MRVSLAGIIDEIGIVEIINEQLGIKPQEKLNNGIIVKSIILNALGFVSRPLYLFTQFFNDKAIPIKIVHGYSKDKRPDLKQFLINLIASGDGGIPLFLECGNGNDNDKAKFAQLLSNFGSPVEVMI